MAKKLISAYAFAKLKEVTPRVIYLLIKGGKIKTEQVGKHHYFDLNKYEHIQFKVPKIKKDEGEKTQNGDKS